MRRLAALALVLAVLPAAAAAEDPPLVNWPQLAPAMAIGLQPGHANECTRGDLRCVDAVIRHMERRFRHQARDCHHDAVFALGYLRTTQEYRRAVTTPGFFADPAFLNHYDAVFAAYYFEAEDAWQDGDVAGTPPAWRVAFRAAQDRRLDASGNFLLGMNAHINRDLPFVLAAIGLTAPDGSSRRPDHNAVNGFLNRVGDALSPEVAQRLDPSFDDSEAPTTADGFAIVQLIQSWREAAWRNAEALRAAPPAMRPLVAAGIEAGTHQLAVALRDTGAYPPGESSAVRDAWCDEHWDDWDPSGSPDDGGTTEAASVPGLQPPAPSHTLAQLAFLGVHVDVSTAAGVRVSTA